MDDMEMEQEPGQVGYFMHGVNQRTGRKKEH